MMAKGGIASNALGAAAIAILQMGVAISLAALIFSGPLQAGAGRAAAAFLLGTAIVSFLVGSASKMSVVIAGAQDTAAIMVMAVASSIAASGLAPDIAVPTVIVMLAICALGTGVTFVVLGQFGWSSFVRFLPYPVITGFTAGTGWLLLRGGLEVMNRAEIHIDEVTDLFAWSQAKFLIPGLALAAVMLLVVSIDRLPNALVSVAILVGTGLFHLVGQSLASLQELESEGWLVGPFPEDTQWTPVGPSDLRAADWGVLVDNSISMVAVVAVSVIGMLLNLSGLEGGQDTHIEMNSEMRTAGFANLLVGAGGGLVGYHLIGDTSLARQLGAKGKAVPIGIAGISITIFLLGPGLIGLVPRSVAGGVLAGLGVTLLASWSRTLLPSMSRVDGLLSVLILAVIALLGVLPGVGFGVLIAAALFVVRYSRINPVRHILDGAGRSAVDRTPDEMEILDAAPDQIIAVELQGFLFFGSTTGVRNQIDQRARPGTTEFVIIDFSRVTGLDSTAATGLQALADQLRAVSITTVLSGMSPETAAQLNRNRVTAELQHRDLDHAIAWCEEVLCGRHEDTATAAAHSQNSDPASLGNHVARILNLPVIELSAGDTLITAGSSDSDLFYVETGTLTAWLDTDDNQIRVRRVQPGSALGEVAFCTGTVRSATVIADTNATVRVLTRARFDEVATSQPELAMAIQNDLLQRLGSRLSTTSAMVRYLH